MNILQFSYEVLIALEMLAKEGKGLTRNAIRHAISMMSPLGSRTEDIDRAWVVICDALERTGLLVIRNGVYMWAGEKHYTPPQTNNAELN